MVAVAGEGPASKSAPEPGGASAGVTFCAEAPPVFLTVIFTVMGWPWLTVDGVAAIAEVRAAGAWITSGPAFAEADTVAPLSASVPLTLAAHASDPEPVVWYVHWKLR